MRRLLLLAFALALLAAACGNGPNRYSVAKTRKCLVSKDVRMAGTPDFVALTATGGAFVARFRDGNFVTASFGDSEDDAMNTEAGYRRAAFANVREGIADVLKRDRNAVLLWHEHPEAADAGTVKSCLK